MGLVLLAVPVSLGYNSAEKWFKVTWLGLTITRRWGREKPLTIRRKTGKKPGKVKGGAILPRLWRQRELVTELINRLGRFALEVGRTLSFRDSEASLSLPDPMWNGVLYGVLTNIQLKHVNLSVNFENRNYAKLWVTAYPYRVAWKLAALLIRLPYLNLLRFAWDLKNQVREV
ncbi:MAG: hypothetical protein ACHQ2F_10035 [Desulfobaccales bacterium]